MATKKEEIEVKVANDDTRIEKVDQVLPPIALLEKFPASQEAADLVHETRLHAHNIIHGKDDRLLVVIGPCSIHDPKAALDYAKRLKVLRDEYKDTHEFYFNEKKVELTKIEFEILWLLCLTEQIKNYLKQLINYGSQMLI